MKIYGLQFDIAWENKEANRERLRQLFKGQSFEKDSLVVLPEMTCTGFTQTVEGLAENSAGPTESFYARLAAEHNITLVGGVIQQAPTGKGRNVALALSPRGERITDYTKMHPFTFSGENNFFERGDKLSTFSWQGLKVAPFICYDLRFPEIFRAVAGVELYTVIANWPAPREKHWMTLLQARAIENQAYVIGINRCGTDPKVAYSGRSLIIDPQGVIVADAGSGEGFIEAELDIAELRAYRERFPALSDRRDFAAV
ncbi:unnamed protein product [Phaeothamnion confervicola]